MQNPKNQTQNLSADELKLREMCRALKKTDAPPDFDFKLKARIASAKPSDFKSRYGFLFRYALPALAVILLFAILAFNGGFLSPGNNPSVAESSVVPPAAATAPPQNTMASTLATPEIANQNSAAAPENQTPPKNSEVATADKAPRSREVKNTGGSKILPLSGSSSELKSVNNAPVLNPKGLDPKSVPQNVQNNEPTNPMPVRDVLSFIGINADLENGKWKVKSVTANSVGESSDVKVNDIIESIDDQPLSTETINGNRFSGKTLTVSRSGEKLQLRLRGKQ